MTYETGVRYIRCIPPKPEKATAWRYRGPCGVISRMLTPNKIGVSVIGTIVAFT